MWLRAARCGRCRSPGARSTAQHGTVLGATSLHRPRLAIWHACYQRLVAALAQRRFTRPCWAPLFLTSRGCSLKSGVESGAMLTAAQERRCSSFANGVSLLMVGVYLILFSFILHNFTFPPEEIAVSILVKSLCMSPYTCLLGQFYYTSLAL